MSKNEVNSNIVSTTDSYRIYYLISHWWVKLNLHFVLKRPLYNSKKKIHKKLRFKPLRHSDEIHVFCKKKFLKPFGALVPRKKKLKNIDLSLWGILTKSMFFWKNFFEVLLWSCHSKKKIPKKCWFLPDHSANYTTSQTESEQAKKAIQLLICTTFQGKSLSSAHCSIKGHRKRVCLQISSLIYMFDFWPWRPTNK